MQTKVRLKESKNNSIDENLEKKIKESLETKWFYSHKFISEKDIKSSIQSSYLWVLKYFWYLSLFLIYLWKGRVILQSTMLSAILFLWLFCIVFILFKWSFIIKHFLKSSEILITNRWTLHWWEVIIWKWEDFYLPMLEYIRRKVGNYFFNISVQDKLKELRKFWKWKWALFDMINYIVILTTYYITFPIIWPLSKILWKIWFFFYKIKNKDLVFLDESSKQIENIAESIKNESKNIKTYLKNWEYSSIGKSFETLWELVNKGNSLWIRINEKFTNLEKIKDIFDLSMFQNWMKKEIHSPFDRLVKLLTESKNLNIQTTVNLESLIEKENESSLKNPLILQKERLEIQKQELEKFENLIQWYLLKLK